MLNLNARMNAEGLSFAAIEAAIIECGNPFRTNGWIAPSDDLKNMASEDVISAIYPRAFRIKVRGTGYIFRGHMTMPEFREGLKTLPEGTLMECEIDGDYPSVRDVLVRKNADDYAIVAEYDHFRREMENSCIYFLPTGIRALVAEKLGIDFNSSTFHQAFDAIVEGTADYI